MKISIIAALSQNRVIGNGNELPWVLPKDMKYFKKVTTSNSSVAHNVIMGRKTWESIPEQYRPLVGRINWIVSRNSKYYAKEAKVTYSFERVLFHLSEVKEEVFVVGGSEIYQAALPYATKMYLTEIHASIEGDKMFPVVDMSQWEEVSRESHNADEKHQYNFDFVVYERKQEHGNKLV